MVEQRDVETWVAQLGLVFRSWKINPLPLTPKLPLMIVTVRVADVYLLLADVDAWACKEGDFDAEE